MLRALVEKEETVTQVDIEEMGPIDYIVLEWPGRQPKGDAVPLIVDLVERGVIRVLDIALMVKGDDGSVAAVDLGDLEEDAGFGEFAGASTGLLTQEDLVEAAEALAPGTSAAVLVWENLWAAPVAVALRRSGGQLVASGRIEIQAVLAALEAAEAATPTLSSKEHPNHARIASWSCPHGGDRRYGDVRQQPRLPPPGQPLVPAGDDARGSLRAAGAAAATGGLRRAARARGRSDRAAQEARRAA